MNFQKIIFLGAALTMVIQSYGGQKFDCLAKYREVEITGISVRGITIIHSNGISVINKSDLSETEISQLESELKKVDDLREKADKMLQLMQEHDIAIAKAIEEAQNCKNLKEQVQILSTAKKKYQLAGKNKKKELEANLNRYSHSLRKQLVEQKRKKAEEMKHKAEERRREEEAKREKEKKEKWLKGLADQGLKVCPGCKGEGWFYIKPPSSSSYYGIRELGCKLCNKKGAIPLSMEVVSCDYCHWDGFYRPICTHCNGCLYVPARN